jgi:hypothetical protein
MCTIMAQVLGITGLSACVECAFVQSQFPEICRLSHAWAVPGAACRPAAVNSLFSPSPTDALTGLKGWCRLATLAPIRQGLHTFTAPAWDSSHSGGPRAGAIRGFSVCAPMCAKMWRMSAL